jgi:hypothetical protein
VGLGRRLRTLASFSPILLISALTAVCHAIEVTQGVTLKKVGKIPTGFKTFAAYAMGMQRLAATVRRGRRVEGVLQDIVNVGTSTLTNPSTDLGI